VHDNIQDAPDARSDRNARPDLSDESGKRNGHFIAPRGEIGNN
jgi:hypothetical protein